MADSNEKPDQPWWQELLKDLGNKGLWALTAFVFAYFLNLWQTQPSNNLNIRSVAIKIRPPAGDGKNQNEPSAMLERCTVKNTQTMNNFLSKNPGIAQIDKQLMSSPAGIFIINDLEPKTKEIFNSEKKNLCDTIEIPLLRDPPVIEVAAIISTDATYLLDRDCKLHILKKPKNTGIQNEFWNITDWKSRKRESFSTDHQPVQNQSIGEAQKVREITRWKLSWPFLDRTKILHSSLPIRAVTRDDKGSADETFIVAETGKFDFDIVINIEDYINFKTNVLDYLTKGNKLPIAVECDVVSVGEDPVTVTSAPFFAVVKYLDAQVRPSGAPQPPSTE